MRALSWIAMSLLLASCGGPPPPADPTVAAAPEPEQGPEQEPDRAQDQAPEPARSPAPEREPAPAPARGGLDASAQAFLDAHNRVRAAHCAPPLTWSPELAKVAQAWADQLRNAGCAFEHSRTRYGENLAGGTSGALSPASVTEMWYREVGSYDFKRGGFSMDTGHFTQVVWRDTRSLGCGKTTCRGMDIYVCNYDPPGNVQGQYRDQVQPTGCK
ncbi:MAG TPA: CAP domain-containing protein [Kofleriaceae bacterium]|nr:CAP domain-containing protein [Kofleriaceae bacterium]